MVDSLLIPTEMTPSADTKRAASDFLQVFRPYEVNLGQKIPLYLDKRSKAYYIVCHLSGEMLVRSSDLEATLDVVGDDDELYKLNREITEDQAAYKQMEEDAINGRSFEDVVLEYDNSYRPQKPLKVYGGQHRIRAISKVDHKNMPVIHGTRIYFSLTRDQKVEIATINNTSISVPNDLLDRMREQLLGSELRDWCQSVGLLEKGTDFADRRSPNLPTVRVIRTLLVNYYLGIKEKQIDSFHQPVVCKSGGLDDYYINLRKEIKWDDDNLAEMGKQYSRLHKLQQERVNNRSGPNGKNIRMTLVI